MVGAVVERMWYESYDMICIRLKINICIHVLSGYKSAQSFLMLHRIHTSAEIERYNHNSLIVILLVWIWNLSDSWIDSIAAAVFNFQFNL